MHAAPGFLSTVETASNCASICCVRCAAGYLPAVLNACIQLLRAACHTAGYLSAAHYLVLTFAAGLEAKRAALASGFCPPELAGACLGSMYLFALPWVLSSTSRAMTWFRRQRAGLEAPLE